MSAALWMIIYDLDRANADTYLQWFDDVHIPEKLARPGYTWAAHYRAVAGQAGADSKYIALFGGVDSRVFYDPSPAQIKPTQSAETRRMMAYRSNSQMLILGEEWAQAGDTGGCAARVDAETIRLALFDANDNDETLGAWLVQDYLAREKNYGMLRKYLASTGAVRHVLIQACSDDQAGGGALAADESCGWSEQIPGYLSYPLGLPLIARRAWPPVE